MNVVASDLYEWVVDQPEQLCRCALTKEDFASQPSLTASTDSETSSVDDTLSLNSRCDIEGCCSSHHDAKKPIRRVSFHDQIQVREYSITVGDHPCCVGGLPLTLDWFHAEEFVFWSLEEFCRERKGPYKLPRKLTYERRRERLFGVSAYSEERVRNEEIDMVMNFLQCSWSQHSLLPLPDFDDLEDQDDDEDDVKPSKEQVFQWKRVMQRSQSFMD